MKIIKVIHAYTSRDLQSAQEAFSLENYDLETFITKQESKAISLASKELTKNLLEKNLSPKDLAGMGVAALFPQVAMMRALADAKGVFPSQNSKESRELFAKISVRQTARNLIDELLQNLETVDVISLEKAREDYPRTRNLSIGTYTLHPRDSSCLTRIEHYHKNLALEKDDELIVLLGRMGAETLRISEVETQHKAGRIEAELNPVSASIRNETNLSKHLDKGKELSVEFEGNVVDIDSSLLQKSLWFRDDSRLLSIFESRLFKSNKIKEYTLKNTYTETFDFDFDLAAKHMVVNADLKAEYRAISQKERLFHVKFGELT